MELLQLRYFFESAQSGSFSKTAKKYMVPLTSVSASIRRLEQELDCPLFVRHPNCVSLNEKGKILQKALWVVFGELDAAIDKIGQETAPDREIHVLIRGMRRMLTELIMAFRERYPNSAFKISFDFDETDVDGYDVIIDEESELYAEYQKFEFYTTRLRIKCAENDSRLGKKLLMKQLRDASFISMGEESNLHKVLLATCRQAGFTPKITALCNDLECYEKMIAGGMGIAIGREQGGSAGIAYLDVRDFDERYTLYCYHKADNHSTVKSFVEFLNTHSVLR